MSKKAKDAILRRVIEILGPFPDPPDCLNEQILDVQDAGDHTRKKVVLLPDDEDPIFSWLLVPKPAPRRGPAVLCLHSTTKGSGKDLPAGVAGFAHGDPPVESRSYALELVRRGYVALAPDMLCDGERITKGLQPYDTSEFYRSHPGWSAAGKIIWDAMRAMDYLCSLEIVDAGRIGVIGHSHGAHYGVLTAMFDKRIKAVVCNGGVLYCKGVDPSDPLHWARDLPGFVHIPRLRPFYERRKFPMEFWEFISPIAPRPLLCMDGRDDGNHSRFRQTYERLRTVYEQAGHKDNLMWFSYPGGHDFPPTARRKAYSWLDGKILT